MSVIRRKIEWSNAMAILLIICQTIVTSAIAEEFQLLITRIPVTVSIYSICFLVILGIIIMLLIPRLLARPVSNKNLVFLTIIFSSILAGISMAFLVAYYVLLFPSLLFELSIAIEVSAMFSIPTIPQVFFAVVFPGREIEVVGGNLTITAIGILAMSMGITFLTIPALPHSTVNFSVIAGPIFGSGLTLIATGLQEYFRSLVTTPILRIEVLSEPAIRKPILTTFPDFCGTQRPPNNNIVGYLRLAVRNVGRGAAKDCVAQVRVLERLDPSGYCKCVGGPSGEYVDWLDLTWAGNVARVNINPNDVRIINLVAMPLDVSNKPFFVINQNLCQNIPTACGGSLPYAWFARPDVMAYGCLNRMQDCLTKLIYMIEVQVTCENGRAEPVRLKLIIGDDWDHTDVVKVS